jgi:Gly-Xaa carboxypeptidase
VKDLIQRTETVFKDLAHRLNLTFTSFGETVSAGPSKGSLITSDDWNSALESAPISPTDAAEYHLLAGTIRATYNTHRGLEDGEKPVIVSPGIMSGNTGREKTRAL